MPDVIVSAGFALRLPHHLPRGVTGKADPRCLLCGQPVPAQGVAIMCLVIEPAGYHRLCDRPDCTRLDDVDPATGHEGWDFYERRVRDALQASGRFDPTVIYLPPSVTTDRAAVSRTKVAGLAASVA